MMFRLLTIEMGKILSRRGINGEGVSAMTRLFSMFDDENRIIEAFSHHGRGTIASDFFGVDLLLLFQACHSHHSSPVHLDRHQDQHHLRMTS